MNMLILEAAQQTALNELNASGIDSRQLQAIDLGDGRNALNADLLNDCAPDQTWDHYGPLLLFLPIEDIELPPPTGL